MAATIRPIWKDYFVTLASGVTGGVKFRISAGGSVVYEGKAFPKPGTSFVEVRINDICAAYLHNIFPPDNSDWYTESFEVEAYISDTWTSKAQVTFYRDWSYDRKFSWQTNLPFAPITPLIHGGGYLPIYSYNGAYSFDLIFAPDSPGDFCNDFNNDFDYYGNTRTHIENDDFDEGDFYFCYLASYPNLIAVEANGLVYQVAKLCGGYALYYLNAYGGWDTIPVQGRTIRSSAINHHTYDPLASNLYASNRGRTNYVNEIERKYKLNIGPLTSDQATRMAHLLESPFVYLHDIQRDELLPIVLTSNAAEVKDVVGNLHTYEVEATLAQERMRR